MRLFRLRRAVWDVLAIIGEEDTCEVLDFLLDKREGQPATRRGLYSFLKETVPDYGPQENNTGLCYRLHPYECRILEFRKQPHKGLKARVLFFSDAKRIICVNGFLKGKTTPSRKVEEAIAARARYLSDKAVHKITIVDLTGEDK